MSGIQTRKSACILCYVNCGIEVEIEDGLMKLVPWQSQPRPACRYGSGIVIPPCRVES